MVLQRRETPAALKKQSINASALRPLAKMGQTLERRRLRGRRTCLYVELRCVQGDSSDLYIGRYLRSPKVLLSEYERYMDVMCV